MKVYHYSNKTRGKELADVGESELRILSGTLFSDLGKKIAKGERVDLEVGVGPEFVNIAHDVENALQLVEGGKRMTVDRTNEVITQVCKSKIENQELALVVAEVIKEGYGIREVRFRVEDVNNSTFSFFGHNGNQVAC